MPQDDMGNIDQTVLNQIKTSMTPKQSLAPMHMNPKMGQSGLGTNIGVGLLKMFVPVIGGAVQQAVKQKKEQQINEAVNDYQVLHTSYENAMIASQNDKSKADEMFGKDPRVRAILDDKKKQKLIAKAFSVDVTNPEKNQNTAHFQALKRFQDIQKATESMKATARQLEQFKAQGKGGQAQESAQGTPPAMSKQPTPSPTQAGAQGTPQVGGHQPQEGLSAKGQAPGQQGGDPVKNFLAKWPVQTKAPTLQDAEKASVTMKNLAETTAAGEPKTEAQMWYKAIVKQNDGAPPTVEQQEAHHNAMRLKPLDMLMDEGIAASNAGNPEEAERLMKLAGQWAAAVKPQTGHPTRIDLILRANKGDKEAQAGLKVLRAEEDEHAMAYGRGRAMYMFQPYIDKQGHIRNMDGVTYRNLLMDGNSDYLPIPGGRLDTKSVLALQTLGKEAGVQGTPDYDKGVIKEIRTHLKGFDNSTNRAIFAKAINQAKPGGDWVETMHNVLDQVAVGQLDEDGVALYIAEKRLADTMGTFRVAMGLGATDRQYDVSAALMPGASTPNSEVAGKTLDQLETMIKLRQDVPAFSGDRKPDSKAKPKMSMDDFLNSLGK